LAQASAATQAGAQTPVSVAAAAPASPTVAAPAEPAPSAQPVPPFALPGVSPAARPAAHTPPTPPSTPAPATPTPHKRSSVQVVLLLVGVTLVSVAAIVFLTVAFVVAGLAVRSAIVGLFTVAMLITAGLLRRKGLVSTAEGIGALAVVLVLLDAWALRENDLFGFGTVDGLLYWGVTLTVCTALFLLWHAVSSLRVASVAGFAAAAPAVGLLAAGLAADAEPVTRVFLAALGVAAGALLHRFTRPGTASFWPAVDRTAERIALLALAALALATATLTAGFVAPAETVIPLLTFGAVAAGALAHAVVALTGRTPGALYRSFAYASASLATLAVVFGIEVFVWRTDDNTLLVTLPLPAIATLALGLELAWRRRATGPARIALLTAALTAASFVAAIGAVALATAAAPLASALLSTFTTSGDPLVSVNEMSVWALATLTGVAVLVAGFWRAGAVLAPRLRILAWFGLVMVLLAVPFTEALWLVLPLYLLLGAAALTVLLLARAGRLTLGGYRPIVVTLFIASEALGYTVSWASSASWWLGTLSAVLTVFVARLLLNRESQAGGRGALLSGAIVLTLVGAAAAPEALTLAAPPTPAMLWLLVALAVASATGLLQLFLAQGRIGGFTAVERRAGFWTLFAPTLLGVLLPTGRIIDGLSGADRATMLPAAPVAGILAAALTAAAMLLWTLTRGGGLRWERFTAALLVAPAVLALTVNLISLTEAPGTVSVLAAPIAALLTVALALVLRTLARTIGGTTGSRARSSAGLEIGAAVVLASVFLRPGLAELGWLVLLLTAVVLLLTAIDADGLFASASWRRHVGWLSLVAATAGLWWGLARAGTTPVEAYVLPLAGLLLLLAALLWRYGRIDRAVTASRGAALLTLAGLSVALLPLALSMQTGSPVRPVIVGAASAVLLIGATLVRWAPPRSAYLAATALAGALGLLSTGIARSLRLLDTAGATGPLLEAWLLPTVVITAVAAFLLVRHPDARTRLARDRASVLLLVVALGALTVLETASFDTSALAAGRAIALVGVLAVGHVLALWRPQVPLGTIAAWTSAALAGFAAGAAVVGGTVEPFELETVPVGLALVAGQLVTARLRATDGARPAGAWAWTGAGLALALLPSAVVAAAPGATTLGAAGLSDDAVRQLVTLTLGGLLAVAGAVLLGRPRWSLLAWPGLLVGTAAVVVTATGRILALVTVPAAGADWRLEAWLLPAALLLVVTGGIIIRHTPFIVSVATAPTATRTRTVRRSFGYGLVGLALLGILGAETAALPFGPCAEGRVIALVALFAVLHVALHWFDRSPAGTVLAWFSWAAGLVALLAGLGFGLPAPLELTTGPLGLSLILGQLLAAGLLGPARNPASLRESAAGPVLQAWLAVGLGLVLLPSAVEGAQGALLRPVLVLTVGGILTVGGALLISRPRWRVVAWPGVLVGAVAVAVAASGRIRPLLGSPAGPDGRLEAWLLPAALLLIGAGYVIIARSPALVRPVHADAAAMDAAVTVTVDPAGPRRLLGYGLVIVALTGILGTETAALPYTAFAAGRVIALIALFAVLQVAVRWFDRSRAGVLLAWLLVAAGFLVLVAGLGRDLLDPVEVGTVPLGIALVVGQLISARVIGRARGTAFPVPSARLVQSGLVVGLAALVLPSALLGAEGTPVRAVLSLAIGGALAVLGALQTTHPRWTLLAWPACLVGTLTVLTAAGLRILTLPGAPAGPSGELEAWLLPAAALLVATGTCLVWVTRSTDSADATSLPLRSGYGLVVAAMLGTVLAEVVALGYPPLATVRVALVVWVFAAVFLAAFWGDRSPLGRLIAGAALAGAAGMLVAGLFHDVPDPVEIVTVPLALALVAAGLVHLRRVPAAGSWPALAPGLLLLLVPSLLLDLSVSPVWRVVGLGVVAIAVLLLGTARRLQAPFVLGATVLLLHALAQLWPWIALLYVSVQWWLWLGIGGVLLIVLAARYEQRIQNFKTAALKISALR
ncbi:SCO7613 C-terminal domain-containing membrane protein, partial [Cryobacterium sp. TMB1-7]|uniref:SCO7613 C-terminal domain-containing membrane protein n=1 Tax=Cryobacterium sp. TMB1-7 TaxID=2555866 RepID=UPI00351A4384